MEVLFISHKASPEYIKRKGIENPRIQISNIKWCNLISKGLNLCDRINSVTELAVPSFNPWPQSPIYQKQEKMGNTLYLSCLNIVIIKNILMTVALLCNIYRWTRKNKSSNKIVIISCVHPMFLLALYPFKSLKTISFVPDIPALQNNYTREKSIVRRFFLPPYLKLCKKLEKNIDAFVFITKYMTHCFPQKPFTIMEGLVDIDGNNILTTGEKKEANDKFKVFYAGALFEKMGIKSLVDSMSYISRDLNVELILAGDGDMVDYIKSTQARDDRIVFLGRVTNEEVLRYEHLVNLLINPRPTTEDFVKYSFPSKTMEYMLSATPVLTTKLPGIPNDYDEHLFYINNESAEGIAESIIRCKRMNPSYLKTKGKDAQLFVLQNKNCRKQINNVMDALQGKI